MLLAEHLELGSRGPKQRNHPIILYKYLSTANSLEISYSLGQFQAKTDFQIHSCFLFIIRVGNL